MKECQKHFNFAYSLLITHEDIADRGINIERVDKLDYRGYNEFVAMRLWQYVDAPYCLLVQNDGYILRPEKWTDAFYAFDYIGAPWPVPQDETTYRTPEGELVRVGNGGFSFRSKKLLEAPTKLGLEFTDRNTGFPHEDGFLCVHSRQALLDYGIKFAPIEIAAQFSTELTVPESVESFGFHRYK